MAASSAATLISQETNLVGTIVNAELTTTGTSVAVEFIDSKTGDAREPQSTTLYFVINKDNSSWEMIKADSHSTTNGVTTITINSSGRAIPKLGIGAGSATGNRHPVGSQVGCVYTHNQVEQLNNIMDGTNGTSGTIFKIGNAVDEDIKLGIANSDTNEPFIMYDASENQWVVSHDGISTVGLGGASVTITGGDGITVTAGDIDIDTSDTTIFVKTSSGAGDEDKAPILDSNGKLATGFITAGNLADYIADVSTTEAEIDQALDGISANVTATALNALTAGAASNADAYHTHSSPALSFTAYETISTDDAVCALPVECQWYAQLTEADLPLGSANSTRRRAVKITPSETFTGTLTIDIRGKENGTSTMTLTPTIETDSSGEPSGTAITNGTGSTVDTSSWGTSYDTRTLTWGSSITLTAGTDYWLVLAVDATDASNYVDIGSNSSYDENYLTFTMKTYDLDTASWDAGATNNAFFFWGNSTATPFGCAIAQCDADFGGRTWSFVGFAKAGGAAGASIDVYYNAVPDLSGLEIGADYYLSTTAGAISTSVPNSEVGNDFAYRIGKAISTTDLVIEKGEKSMWGFQRDTSSTTTQVITWFKPRLVIASGSGDDSVSDADISVSPGFYDGTSHGSVYIGADLAGAPTSGSSSSYIVGNGFPSGQTAVVAASAVSNVGFTFDSTITSTTAVMWAWEARA